MDPNLICWPDEADMLWNVWCFEFPGVNEKLPLVVKPSIQSAEQFRRMCNQFNAVFADVQGLGLSVRAGLKQKHAVSVEGLLRIEPSQN